MKLLYYCPASYGGIADYAQAQANALVVAGVEVTLLTPPKFPSGQDESYRRLSLLQEMKPTQPLSNKVRKGLRYVAITLSNIQTLVQVIQAHQFQWVLLATYSEYLAPLWAGALRRLTKQGVILGAIVHDPVRDFVVGPRWWHRWSIASGYSFLQHAFVHDPIELDTVRPMPLLQTTVIPHGIYTYSAATRSRQEMRSHLHIPPDAKVMLAFGHLRPNKNLDLVIQAMAQVPEVYLVVVGNETSTSQPLAPQYQTLAAALGVGARIRWHICHIPDQEIANFFIATDLVILTYSQSFRSASGVLNTAAFFQKPCLASGGKGNLASVIQHYGLGIWIKPDDVNALVGGLRRWLEHPLDPDWMTYQQENTWATNTELILRALKG